MSDKLREAAWEDFGRARAGEDVTRELLAHATALAALPWSQETFAVDRLVRLALLASPKREGIDRVIEKELPLGCSATVTALLLPDDDPLRECLPENPWHLPPDIPLAHALEQLWRPIDDPDFLGELKKRVLGLALLREAGGAAMLGYLLYQERDSFDVPLEHRERARPSFDRRAAFAWQPFGDATLVVGRAPAAGSPTLRPGVRVPPCLAELYAIHGGMKGGLWSLYSPGSLLLWSEMLGHDPPRFVNAEDEDEERMSDQLLAFFSYGDDRSDLFDLAEDDPPVRAWGDGMLYASEGEPFWDWFTDKHTLILRRAEG